MEMKNQVLIFIPYSADVTHGGPAGFAAQNLAGHVLQHAVLTPNRPTYSSLSQKLWRGGRQLIGLLSIPPVYRWEYTQSRFAFKHAKVSEYKFVYFHDMYNLFFCRDLLRESQTVILQPHMPELLHEEEITFGKTDPEFIRWVKHKVTPAVFGRANFVVMPNPGALAIYKSVIAESSKIIYLLSGARQPSHVTTVPFDPQYVYLLFIGRRDPIKGFDLLLEAFKRAYLRRPELRLVLIGSGKTETPGIIDLGYSQRPHDWIASVDWVINCNRQSYLDLSVLETLANGTPLLMTCTWGHEVFKNASPGIIDFGDSSVDNIEQALLKIGRKIELGPEAMERNRELYQKSFSDAVYRKKLDETLGYLVNDNSNSKC